MNLTDFQKTAFDVTKENIINGLLTDVLITEPKLPESEKLKKNKKRHVTSKGTARGEERERSANHRMLLKGLFREKSCRRVPCSVVPPWKTP